MNTSLKDYSLNIEEEAYHNYPAWSHSLITEYARNGFGSLATLHDKKKPTPSMKFGSLFDSILTKGKDTLNEYAVADFSVPEAERKALEYIASCTEIPVFDDLDKNYIYEKAQEAGYQMKWGVDAKYSHLMPYKEYYDTIKSGKKLVSQEEWDDAVEMAKVFRTDSYLKDLFGTKSSKDIEYLYQLKFVEDVVLPSGKTVKMKIMPDLIVMNHKDKTIQPVDLKTSSEPGWNFKENFLKFRYDIQACVYSDVLSQVIDRDPELKDYSIQDYLFTDISRSDKIAVTYRYPQNDPTQRNGLTFTSGEKTYTYKNWMTLLDEILAYEEQQAKVPSYITLDGPNDLLSILGR